MSAGSRRRPRAAVALRAAAVALWAAGALAAARAGEPVPVPVPAPGAGDAAVAVSVPASAPSFAPVIPATSPGPAPPAPPADVDASPRRLLVMLRPPPAHARLDGGYGGGYGGAVERRALQRLAARIAASHDLALVSQWPMPVLGLECAVMTLPAGRPLDEVIRQVQAHAEVAWAQADQQFTARGGAATGGTAPAAHGHADPLYPLQPVASLWRLDLLHEAVTGRHVRVALIDSGVDVDHPDLARQVASRENFVAGQAYRAEWHGTAVAGLVAARADNGQGIVGVAPDARLVSLRACWQEGEGATSRTVCDSLSLAKALHHAIEHPAEIVNMSLSGPPDPLIGRLIDAALSRHLQVVAAVDPSAPGGGFPAGHPGVVAVRDAATPPRGDGPADAWCAPARDLPATVPGGGWRLVTGTSFAAAEVSGLLALLRQARDETEGAPMAAGATSSPPLPGLVRTGDGGIDACASLEAATARPGREAGPRVAACRAALPVRAAALPGVSSR